MSINHFIILLYPWTTKMENHSETTHLNDTSESEQTLRVEETTISEKNSDENRKIKRKRVYIILVFVFILIGIGVFVVVLVLTDGDEINKTTSN